MTTATTRCRRTIAGASLAALTFVGVSTLTSHPRAQTATAQLQVLTTVVKRCTITTTNVALGNYDPITANLTTPLDGAGAITVTCTQGTVATIGIDNGSNAQSGVRRMAGGASFLTYELYKDTGRTQVWGGTGAAQMTLPAAPSTAPRNYPVYGRVPQAQDVGAGAYLDTAIATVNF